MNPEAILMQTSRMQKRAERGAQAGGNQWVAEEVGRESAVGVWRGKKGEGVGRRRGKERDGGGGIAQRSSSKTAWCRAARGVDGANLRRHPDC
jgi:hypothetical protein